MKLYVMQIEMVKKRTNERVREGEDENPTQNCKHVPLGQYKVTSGAYKGSVKSKQARCKYCPERKKKRRSLEFHRLHVFAAAFMTLPFVENTIVGNAIWQKFEEICKKD